LSLFFYRLHKKIADIAAFVKNKKVFFCDYFINEKPDLSMRFVLFKEGPQNRVWVKNGKPTESGQCPI